MVSKSYHARQVYAQIEKQLGSSSTEDVVWGVVEGTAALIDGITELPCAGPAGSMLKIIVSLYRGSGAESLIDNPYFVGNGQGEDDPSARTRQYIASRQRKDIGGGVASIAGGVASIWTAVDVAGIAMHGNASSTTLAHIRVLADQASKARKGGTVAQWLELVIKMKALKLGARGAGLASATVPIPAVGITGGLIAAAIGSGSKLTLTKACLATALELHWRAKQEQFMSGSVLGSSTGGKVGPASRIVWELFTKRGLTRILGRYDIAAFVNEPAGWQAIADKLLLM